MKTLSAIAKELGVSVAAVSYVYHGKWREKRIHPDLAERVRRKLEEERAVPDALGRQLQSGRTQTVGVLLPHLDQHYFLNLLAGIERRLGQSDYMVLLGSAHGQREVRQVQLLERMLARRVDALVMCPYPAADLIDFVVSMSQGGDTPLVFVDNYLRQCPAGRVLSDNRWGAREAVRKMLAEGRRRILLVGGDSTVAAVHDRCLGYSDAMEEARLDGAKSLTVWGSPGEQTTLESLRGLLSSDDRPDAILTASFFRFFPVLKLLDELGLSHPADVLLAGFDQPSESWAQDTVRRVIREPLLTVVQAATEIGGTAVDLALAAIGGNDVMGQQRLIRPNLSWQRKE